MLAPLSQSRAMSAKVASMLAPVLGWNRRDPLANMKNGYAVILDNWFPLPESIQLRAGCTDWTTGIGSAVKTLIAYRPQSGNQKLFGFAGGSLYDTSSSGAVGAALVGSLTSDEWNCLNFATTGGNFLLCANGADELLAYDGTNWEAINSSSTMFAISNVATTDLISLFVHKERIYYIQKDSMSVWFPVVGALGGALTELNLSAIFSRGGYLMAGGTWSIDAGDGPDDYACFVTSEGEVAVYKGDDPTSASSWAIVGTFVIGKPIGHRCCMKYGGDLQILTLDGIISAGAAFQTGRQQAKQIAVTDVIRGAVADASSLYKSAYGWQMHLFTPASMLLVNVPVTGGAQQWAMNTITKAWGRFTGWDTTCFEIFNDELYYGGDGVVRKAWTGTSDNGNQIETEVLPAFNYFGSKAQHKQFSMVRPTIQWDTNPVSILLGFDTDFNIETPTQQVALVAGSTGAQWDSATWDTSLWGGSLVAQAEWYSVSGIGLAGAPHMITKSTASSMRLNSFDVVMMPGSIFG